MSTTVTTPQATAATSAGAAAQAGQTAIQSLAGNFSDFLNLLMTQLQNQDPSNPMDTSQFTTQLVQFASVEQQINANANLTQLIKLTQGGQMAQSAAMIGRRVQVASDRLPLQGGTGEVDFTATAAGPVEIGVYADSGVKLRDVTLNATPGANRWTWDGKDDSGNQIPDGAYRAVVMGAGGTPVPFTVAGTVTDIGSDDTGAPLVRLGPLSVDYGSVRGVGS